MTEVFNLGTRVVNTYLLGIGNKMVLVDTGYPDGLKHVKRLLNRLGYRFSELDYIFLTHAHDDHAGFLNAILSQSSARVVAHPAAVSVLLRGQNNFAGGCTGKLARASCVLLGLLGKGSHRFPALSPDFLNRLDVVTENTQAVIEEALGARIIQTPGHTACSISLLTEDGRLFCGDAAMNGFPSTGRVTIWAEDMAAFGQSWDTMIALAPVMLYPGHGQPFPVADLARYRQALNQRRILPLR